MDTLLATDQDELSHALTAAFETTARLDRGTEEEIHAMPDAQMREAMPALNIDLHATSQTLVDVVGALVGTKGVKPDNVQRITRAMAADGSSFAVALTLDDRKSIIGPLKAVLPALDPVSRADMTEFLADLDAAPCGELCDVLP